MSLNKHGRQANLKSRADRRGTRMCKRCSGTGREFVPGIPAVSPLYGGPGTPAMKAYTKNCDGCDGRGSL